MNWFGKITSFISSSISSMSSNSFEHNKMENNQLQIESEQYQSKIEGIKIDSTENKMISSEISDKSNNEQLNLLAQNINIDETKNATVEIQFEKESNVFHPSKKQNYQIDSTLEKQNLDKIFNLYEMKQVPITNEPIDYNGSMIEPILLELSSSLGNENNNKEKTNVTIDPNDIDKKLIKKRKYNKKQIVVTKKHNLRETKQRKEFHSGIHLYDDNKFDKIDNILNG